VQRLTLFGEPGWGSTIVEAQLVWYGLEFDYHAVGNLFRSEESRQKLAAVNPLAQVPTLVLPGGAVMTESAAITLHLADLTGSDALVPRPAEETRGAFLRWLVFLVANVYPTYTYADDPSRFVADAAAQTSFRGAVDRYAQRLYGVLEAQAREPWFLGERFSAIDLYVGTMTHWRPGRAWFAERAPRLLAIAGRTQALEALAPVWRRNFPDQAGGGGSD
jgi:GST-like protein